MRGRGTGEVRSARILGREPEVITRTVVELHDKAQHRDSAPFRRGTGRRYTTQHAHTETHLVCQVCNKANKQIRKCDWTRAHFQMQKQFIKGSTARGVLTRQLNPVPELVP